MNDTSMTRKTDPKYDDDLVNKRYVDKKLENIENIEYGGDTLPIGAIIGYDGNTVPDGYEEVDDDTGWINITLLNGWTVHNNEYTTPQYRKIGNQVFLRGLIKSTNATSYKFMELPTQFRPIKNSVLQVIANDSYALSLYILSNGEVVVPQYSTTSYDWYSLDGQSYFVD